MSDRFESTPAELLRALAVFGEPPGKEHRRLATLVGLERPPNSVEYSDLFLFQMYPYASVYLGPEGMLGGQARARVAGFWSALGQAPPAEPDHLTALLGLYAALAEGDDVRGSDAEAVLMLEGRAALLHEHLAPWVFTFLGRVRELAKGPYARWAESLEGLLRDEIGRSGATADTLPVHLRVAPELADPREDGAAIFLDGLLAPIRSGFVLTRADLARIAARSDVGLRAGERRYALEHLLSQDAPRVLKALEEEAVRQAYLHEARTAWLGSISDFHARRAARTAKLLGELSVEGPRLLARDLSVGIEA